MRRELRIVLSLCLLIPLCLSADIFWLFKKSTSRVLQDLGGVNVYSTSVIVNGAPGTLTAYAFDDLSSREVNRQLKQRLSVAKNVGGTESAMLTTQEEGRLQRFVLIPSVQGRSSSIVLLFEQSLQELKKRTTKESLEWPEGLSGLPGTPRFTASCAATRTTFVTAETSQEPEAVIRSVDTTLSSSGWTAVPLSTPAFKLFVRGTKTCMAFAMRSAGTTQTTLSVMQRDGAVKSN